MGKYQTKQYRYVLEYLATHSHQPISAGELVRNLQECGQRAGLSTIYRQLEHLTEQGYAHKVITEEGAYYQYCPSGTPKDCFLFKCEHCGRVCHIDCGSLKSLYHHLADQHHFTVDPRRTVLYGCCHTCLESHEK